MDEGGVLVFMMFMALGMAGIFTSHKRKMAEIDSGKGKGTVSASDLDEIKRQLAELRDTTTRFDMSFDTALQRIESRLNQVEQKQAGVQPIGVGTRE